MDALHKAYLATMKCVVVNKAFKQVAEEQTKIKQVKRQLKAIGCGSEHAGQRADNACQVFDHFEKIQENMKVCPSIDICRLSIPQLYFTKNLSLCLMMEENSKAKGKKPKRPLYDDKEFIVLFEMVKGVKAYSKVQHDKRFTTGLVLELQRTVVNQP